MLIKGNLELEELVARLKGPAFSLDDGTRDLTAYLHTMELNAKK